MKKAIALLSVAIMVFTSSTEILANTYFDYDNEYTVNENIPEILSNQIKNNRKYMFELTDQNKLAAFEQYLTPNLDAAVDKAVARRLSSLPLLNETTESILPLTVQQAMDDTDFLFDYLKYGYAGYGFFGGDDNFLEAKKTIQREIPLLYEKGRLNSDELSQLYIKHLQDFLHDGHFFIGSYSPRDVITQYFYSYEGLFFYPDGADYICTIEDADYSLLSVDGNSPEDFLKLTIDPTGHLAYYLGTHQETIFEDHSFSLPIELSLLTSTITTEIEIELTLNYRSYLPFPVYERYEKNGIPILENRSMSVFDEEDQLQMDTFLSDATALSQQKVLILDIRGNGGGSDLYPSTWVKNFASLDYQPHNHIIAGGLNTYTVLQQQFLSLNNNMAAENETNVQTTEILALIQSALIADMPGWHPVQAAEYVEKISNDTVIFVITDAGVGSSGETFVNILRQMENVIFVGNGTSGIYTVANNRSIALPNSHIEIYCGKDLYLPPDLNSIEGKGFQPDLWINADGSDECINRILAFIENYNINK